MGDGSAPVALYERGCSDVFRRVPNPFEDLGYKRFGISTGLAETPSFPYFGEVGDCLPSMRGPSPARLPGGRLAFRAEITVEALRQFCARTRGVVGRAERFGPSTAVLPSARSLRGQRLRVTMSVDDPAQHLRVTVENFVDKPKPNDGTVLAVWSSGRVVPVAPPSSGVARFLLRFLREATRAAASDDRVTITSDADHSPTISCKAFRSRLRPLPNADSDPPLSGGVFLGMLRAGNLSLAGQLLPYQTRSSTRRLYPVRVGLQDSEMSFVSETSGCIVQIKVATPDVMVGEPREMILNSHSVRALAGVVDTFREPNEMLSLHVSPNFLRVTGRDMMMGFGFAECTDDLETKSDTAMVLAQVGNSQIGAVMDRDQLLDVLCTFFPAKGATMLCRVRSGQLEIRRDASDFRRSKLGKDVTYREKMPNIVSFPPLPNGPVCPLLRSPEDPSAAWNTFNVDAVITAVTYQPTRKVLFSIRTDISGCTFKTCVAVTPAAWKNGATYVAVIPVRKPVSQSAKDKTGP